MFERIQQIIGTGFSLHLWNGLIAFIIVMVIGFVTKQFLQTIGRKFIARTDNELDDRLLDIILPRLKWLAIIIGLYLAVEEISKSFERTDTTAQQFIRYGEGIIYIAFVWLITIITVRLIDTAVKFFIQKHAQQTSQKLNNALLPLLNRLIMVLILFIAIMVMLGHFGVDVSSFLVFLGGGSVAIALAAQDTLANMIAGFVIMLDRPFRVGDRIRLLSGEIGDVYEIGLRSTKVLDLDNNLIVSPNSELTKDKIINYSYPRNEIRVLVEVHLAYGTSIERAKEIMLGFAGRNSDLLKQPAPEIFFSVMGESSCTVQLIARTDDWKKKGRAETTLREQIYSAFLEEGISSGYAQHVVQLSNPPSDPGVKND